MNKCVKCGGANRVVARRIYQDEFEQVWRHDTLVCDDCNFIDHEWTALDDGADSVVVVDNARVVESELCDPTPSPSPLRQGGEVREAGQRLADRLRERVRVVTE